MCPNVFPCLFNYFFLLIFTASIVFFFSFLFVFLLWWGAFFSHCFNPGISKQDPVLKTGFLKYPTCLKWYHLFKVPPPQMFPIVIASPSVSLSHQSAFRTWLTALERMLKYCCHFHS